jgi:transposase
MLEAIMDGESDPEQLAQLAVGTLRNNHDPLMEAPQGHVREHHRTMLRLLLAEWNFLNRLVEEVETAIEQEIGPLREAVALLETIPGMRVTAACSMVAEIGATLDSFPDAAHLASWAAVAPVHDIEARLHLPGSRVRLLRQARRRRAHTLLCSQTGAAWASSGLAARGIKSFSREFRAG